jgi:hypothetical protein
VLGGQVERIPARRNGKVRVAIHAEDGFDPSTIDVSSVAFEGASPIKTVAKKGKGARNRSLVLTFEAASIDVAPGSTSACIFGTLKSGRPFSGCVSLDPIREHVDHR